MQIAETPQTGNNRSPLGHIGRASKLVGPVSDVQPELPALECQ